MLYHFIYCAYIYFGNFKLWNLKMCCAENRFYHKIKLWNDSIWTFLLGDAHCLWIYPNIIFSVCSLAVGLFKAYLLLVQWSEKTSPNITQTDVKRRSGKLHTPLSKGEWVVLSEFESSCSLYKQNRFNFYIRLV